MLRAYLLSRNRVGGGVVVVIVVGGGVILRTGESFARMLIALSVEPCHSIAAVHVINPSCHPPNHADGSQALTHPLELSPLTPCRFWVIWVGCCWVVVVVLYYITGYVRILALLLTLTIGSRVDLKTPLPSLPVSDDDGKKPSIQSVSQSVIATTWKKELYMGAYIQVRTYTYFSAYTYIPIYLFEPGQARTRLTCPK